MIIESRTYLASRTAMDIPNRSTGSRKEQCKYPMKSKIMKNFGDYASRKLDKYCFLLYYFLTRNTDGTRILQETCQLVNTGEWT